MILGLWNLLPEVMQIVVAIGIVTVWIVFVAIEIKIICAMRSGVENFPEYLIVLGAQVRGTRITNSLKRRLDRAYEVWRENQEVMIIVSGGQGKGEDISEAEAMERYLLSKGIVSGQILKEDRSTSTRENLRFSRPLIESDKMVGIVTNNFHVCRAILFAKECGYRNVCGISAGTNPILFLNYMVREFFAILWMYVRR